MKKFVLYFLFLFVMIFIASGISHAWQGRMAGMDDPYGLIDDESDYLIHVADIAKEQGVKFYGGYRFNYTNVKTWETEFSILEANEIYRFAGRELKHEALMGSSFALGSGRMGVFFAYDGKRGDFNADLVDYGTGIQRQEDLDNFALRLMYGIPVGNFNVGIEAGIAHKKEKSDLLFFYYDPNNEGYYNELEISYGFAPIMPPFMPYESTYWEIPLKVGFSGKMGQLDTKFTMRGGIIVAGDNKLKMGYYDRSDNIYDTLDGDTKGWSIGADLWLRYHLDNGLSLPFMVRADYQKKTRDARGFLVNMYPDTFYDNEIEETALNLTLGGGVEKAFGQNTRLATGLYYSYISDKKESSINMGRNEGEYEYEMFGDDFPSMTEHRVTLRLAGEHALSPVVALRAGMGLFYGSVKQDVVFGSISLPDDRSEIKFSSDGIRRGIGASLGHSST
jgi:hypothetical protein